MKNLKIIGNVASWDLIGHETLGKGVLVSIIKDCEKYFSLIPVDFNNVKILSDEKILEVPAILFRNLSDGDDAVLYKQNRYRLDSYKIE